MGKGGGNVKGRRWLAGLLTALLLLGTGPFALAEEDAAAEDLVQADSIQDAPAPETDAADGAYFPDVPNGKWYTKPVNYLAERGIVGGMPDGLYHPGSRVTRAEFVKLLAVLSGKDISARRDRNSFSDVASSAWYAPYVRWGMKEKIISGKGKGKFDPNSPVTRQEAAAILWRFNKNAMGKVFPQYQKTNFKDSGKISAWASVEVKAVEGAGLMRGYDDRTFRPKAYATRAEMAQILYQYHMSVGSYKKGCAIDDLRYIMHGGGQVGYSTTSNSMEALEESYRNGNRLIEIDFSWTLENDLACLHQWGGAFPPRSKLQDFLQWRIDGWLTPMGLDMLAGWMRAHPEVRVVPDIKERNVDALRMIARKYPDLVERFLPYIYHTSEYEGVAAMGYRNILLILYQMTSGEKTNYTRLTAFAREKNLAGIAIAPFQEYGIYALAGSSGIPVLAYVVDNVNLMYDQSRKGADGFFTDRQNVKIEW